jgi:hypothetical protein
VGSHTPVSRRPVNRRVGSRRVGRCGGRRRVRRRVGLGRSGGRRKQLGLSTDLSMGSTLGSRSSPAGPRKRRSGRRSRVQLGRAPVHTLPEQPARTLLEQPARTVPEPVPERPARRLPVRVVPTVSSGAVRGLLGGCLVRTGTAGTAHCRGSVGEPG